jgi:putative Holliday junction resolvase
VARVLALDYGKARCGCAVSDPSGTLATPLPVIEQPDSQSGLERIRRLVVEAGVESVVVGLPVSLSGQEGQQAAEARAFAARLASVVGVPVDTYDERVTTRLAQRAGGRAAEDSRAAAHLLTDYLRARDARASREGGPR